MVSDPRHIDWMFPPDDGLYRWWSLGAGVQGAVGWLKLGPVAFGWGRFLFIDNRLAFEVHLLNRWVLTNY